ncbi:serine/threonine protein kinase [Candidatus Phycosocius spiralis]|uniref:Serine/threonine protein kinase n=2 Tax=Candidatus Phycosocius spiralis TaxID=2815099 RepID=A0ABQ4PUK2_9PROT|nr:serine/threonine protein kinase [Candidatus Phycosocius spiralis]
MISRRHILAGAALLTTTPHPLSAAKGQSDCDAIWDRLLSTYVHGDAQEINRVDYAAWKANKDDLKALDGVVTGFAALPISSLTKPNQFALWANLYNALTLQVVLSFYPIKSIREIRPSLLSIGPWKQKCVNVEGMDLSLDDIEHGILRKNWADPRVHYCLNCASVGCPNLQRRGWRATSLEADLDAAARTFINSARAVRIVGPKQLRLSSIYQWFKSDFGNNQAGILDHIRRYAAPSLGAQLTHVRIIGYDYDWSINATKGRAKNGLTIWGN